MAIQLELSTLNLKNALDLAVLIEKEAEERYSMFAARLGERWYRGDAVNFFTMMARNERRHGAELAERRRSLFGDTPSQVSANMIKDIEAPDNGQAGLYMSMRHALEVALASEVKAYEFFDQALPCIQDPAVRTLFQELKCEEAEHQILVSDLLGKYPLDATEPDMGPECVDTLSW